MKKVLPAFLTFLLLFNSLISDSYAGKWRVNNTGISAHFTTVQEAASSASVLTGDTLYVEGSVTSYGGLTLTKRLTVIGPGYFLGQNPATQANLAPSMIDYLTFSTGSRGSMITGMTILYGVTLQDSAIVMTRNNFSNVTITEISSDNYFAQNYLNSMSISGSSGNTILNNFFGKSNSCANGNCLSMSNNSSATIKNNMFQGCQVINGSLYQNNIATGTDALGNSTFTATISTVTNNIGASGQYGNSNGNKEYIDMSTVFVNTGSEDGRYQLLPGSPASGAGASGVDCGIFGGSTSYVLSGVPNLPSVWDIYVNGNTVTVKALSH
ncbi:MAG: hypothetical protein ACOYNC_12070 [Bacteroidales bacterium]